MATHGATDLDQEDLGQGQGRDWEGLGLGPGSGPGPGLRPRPRPRPRPRDKPDPAARRPASRQPSEHKWKGDKRRWAGQRPLFRLPRRVGRCQTGQLCEQTAAGLLGWRGTECCAPFCVGTD